MSSKATLTIAYDGPATKGLMDVQDLAPALLSLGKLLEDSNGTLNGERCRVSVFVRSDFEHGSFEVGLEVAQTLFDTAKALIGMQEQAVDAKGLLELLGLSSGATLGLLKLMKLIRGRKITSITRLEHDRTLLYIEGEHDPVEVLDKVVALYQNSDVRHDVDRMMRPLDSPGIDSLKVREKGADIEVITKEERGYFAAVGFPTEEIADSEFTCACTIHTASFEDSLRWRISYGEGDGRVSAVMKDEAFQERIDRGEIEFGKGDVLLVRMRLRQWQTPEGLRTERQIIRVLEHRKAQRGRQVPLLPANGDGEEA